MSMNFQFLTTTLNETTAILIILERFDALERTHRSDQAVAVSLLIMGIAAFVAMSPAVIAVQHDCVVQYAHTHDCLSSICQLIVATGITSLGGSITSLLLNRSNLRRHVQGLV